METKQAILCVDDEAIILLSLIQELKNAFGSRFIYERATDGIQALAIVEELANEGITVIFIISDWLMPNMRGDEFLEAVQIRHPEILSIMITGQANKEAIARVKRNSSVVAIFSKPWDTDSLIRVIKEKCSLSV